MDKLSPPEKQLSFALQYLQDLIAQKTVATSELQSNNQELEAIVERILSFRGELRKVVASNGAIADPEFIAPADFPAAADLSNLKRECDLLLQKSRATIHESLALRAKSKRLRAALIDQPDGEALVTEQAPKENPLSKRERQVLALIVAGKSSKQIAGDLGISFKTAVTHRASIMSKMDVHEIASLVREAIRCGWA